MLTHQRLKEVVSYDAETGVFTWLISTSSRARLGTTAGSVRNDGYVTIRIDGKRHYAHRLAWLYVHGCWPSLPLDHRNRTARDNRIGNLREATQAQNSYNGSGPNPGSSGYRGVVWHNRDRVWQARIRKGNRRVTLGTYHTPEEAAEAYDRAAAVTHGDFAILNFPIKLEIRT